MSIFSKEVKPSIEALQKEHPGIYQEVCALGETKAQEGISARLVEEFGKGKAEGQAAGELIGAKAERERILAVETQSMPGHEKLVAEMKADGKTTGPEAAERVLQAEKTKMAIGLENLETNSPATVKPSADDEQNIPQAKTPDEALKAAWDGKDAAALKAEFGEKGYDSYVGYFKADANFQKTGKVVL
jgi:hypothetical protein